LRNLTLQQACSGQDDSGAVQSRESEAGFNMRIVIVMSGAGPELPTFRFDSLSLVTIMMLRAEEISKVFLFAQVELLLWAYIVRTRRTPLNIYSVGWE
jgi:hypothetical protein